MTAKGKRLMAPELKKGVRIFYRDADGAARAERIHTRKGNTLTVINALKQKTRITIDQVKGYWKPRVRASPENLISLTTEAQHEHKRATMAQYNCRALRAGGDLVRVVGASVFV